MYPSEKLLGLAIIAGIIGVVTIGYLLAWRSDRAASRRAGSLVIAAIAGLVGLSGVGWAIGAVRPIPPPEGVPLWGTAIVLLLLLPVPLGALYISARFFRRALHDEHGKDLAAERNGRLSASHEMRPDHEIPRSPAKKDDTDFGAAVGQFQQFLRANNYSGNLVWVMPEDVLTTGKRFIYVRVLTPAINEMKARRIYDEGMAAGRGLVMSTVCRMNASTYCYIWFPRSVEEVPQGIWPHDGSLKLSAQASVLAGRPIRHRVLWTLLEFWHRKNQRLKDFLFSETGLVTVVRR